MSDDTPTRRFGSPDDEPPTERFDVQADADEEPDGLTQLFGGADDPTGPTTAMPASPTTPAAPASAAPAQPADPLAWLHTGPAAPAADPQTEVLGAAASAARPAADATTMRFDQLPPLPPTEGGSGDEPPSSGPGRGVIIGLAIAGGVLLIAIVVLLVVILGGGGGDADEAGDTRPSTSDTPRPSTTSRTPTPSPSEATPTPEPTTPSPTPTATTPPVVTAPKISGLTATPSPAVCATEADDEVITLQLTWSVSDATSIGVQIDGGPGPAVSGAPSSVGDIPFRCGAASHTYVVTAVNSAGSASVSVTVPRTVTPAPPPEEGTPEG